MTSNLLQLHHLISIDSLAFSPDAWVSPGEPA